MNRAWAAEAAEPQKVLPLAGEVFKVDGRTAFVMLPAAANLHPNRPTPWVWYAPTLSNLPGAEERWMFKRFLDNGIAIAGIDVGESYGNPAGRAHFTALYNELVKNRKFSAKPCLLARSRGGLMLYNWAAEHPDAVGCIAGIYPVSNLRSWPGLDKACGAYGLSAAQLEEQLTANNPIDRLAPLAKAGVPIFHIHGDADEVVPLKDNSALLASRYRELGGNIRMRIPAGQGHNMWQGFFQCEELVEFVIAKASPAASREPTAALFQNPPMEARPGAFWDWMNGNVDLDRITYELEEMKAKGMSGAEIWDIGVIRTHPEEKVPAGPAFLGPESLKAVNHAIEQADRLGLHLGMVASSSWNAGGSWVKPQESMKGIYHSDITVQGPASLSQVLPFPVVPRAPKGEDGLPIYYREIAVLAFPEVKSNTIADVSSVINLSSKMDSKGLLTWEVPAGTWVIQRFVNSMTGEKLKVPSPNSNGLLLDHLDANAARSHFQYIIDQILTMRPSLDAMRYMEVDSVEIGHDTSHDWTDTLVEEFRKRRGYDPIPYLPALMGKSFSDALLTSRFRQDYRKTVSDLWIDGHYRASTKFLNSYGMKLVAEGGHGGYPRVEPLKAMGVVDIPRGEFWNGAQFWVVKEAASAAHIYGLQVVDSESFTGWRSWQDGPLEYKRLADTAFCDGLNRITFHTFAHTPPSGGVPGNMYHAGEHFNVNATWWNQSGPMLNYFSRCCYLLQQGLPVGDACYYYGDAAPNLVATRRIGPDSKRLDGAICAHCGRPNPAPADALGTGYDYDVIDSEVIQDRLQVKDGRLVLPHGVSYEALVLPPNEEMPLPVLAKLEKLVLEGATVLGPRPTRTPSLADSSNSDAKVREITGRLWGAVTDAPPQDKVLGKGLLIPDRNRIREVLQKKGLGPDFSYTSPGTPADLDYIHRRTLNSDIYFVSNTQMAYADAECTFRVHGRKPQFWHPDTGEITPCTGYTRVAGGMKLRVQLPPAGSVFVVFSGAVTADLPEPLVKAEGKPLLPHEITGPWEVRFPSDRGAPESCTLDKLVSWTEMPDEGIKYFSGTATYLKNFEVSEAWIKGDLRVELSLGELRNVAEVTVNGKPLGILWKPPYKVDVTDLLKPGQNELKIDITNLWANRIAGDEKLPREKRVTRITQKLSVPGNHPSGLFGPVQLLNVPCPTQEVSAGKEWKSEPPADCPFEASEAVVGISFTGRNKTYARADTWYSSWASDDRLYSPFTDGSVYLPRADGKTERVFSGSGYNFEELKSPVTGFAVIEGNDPMALKITRAGLIPHEPFPYGGQYPCGSLVYNGVWYYGSYCLDWHKDPWDVMGPFVGFNISKDFGQSWLSEQRTALNPIFCESAKDGRAVKMFKFQEKYAKSAYSTGKASAKVKIGAPHFVDFGKNMEHSPDGHAYMVAHGATRPDCFNSWVTGDHVYLLRVKPSPETMNDPSAWEFYGGKDDKGNTVWTTDFQKIKPLLEWNDHMGIVTATYVPGLKRYIMCVTDGRGPKGDSVGPYDTYLLESGDLTGPWKLASYMKAFGDEAYFVNAPSKFIAADGKTLWLSYSHGWSRRPNPPNPPGGKYSWCLQEIKLLTPANNPLSPGLRSAP